MGFGRFGDGRQYVSWIHGDDFVAAVKFLIGREDLSGAINLCAPNPLPNREFLAVIRRLVGRRIALPVPAWMLEIGTFFLRTETELILKSRRVVPGRLLAAGFVFRHPEWSEAAADLIRRRPTPGAP
jgi:NAD dependent epimerase/dehydratase family enzyme